MADREEERKTAEQTSSSCCCPAKDGSDNRLHTVGNKPCTVHASWELDRSEKAVGRREAQLQAWGMLDGGYIEERDWRASRQPFCSEWLSDELKK